MSLGSSPASASPDRAASLHLLRLVLVVVVLGTVVGAPNVLLPSSTLQLLCGGFLLLAAGLELYRLLAEHPSSRLVRGFVVVDVAYVTGVLILSGGPESWLLFLASAHLVAVVVLLGTWLGLRVALLYGLLLLGSYYLRARGYVTPALADPSPQAATFAIVAFWLIGLSAAAFTRVNERSLQRRAAELRALTQLAASLEQLREVEAALRQLLIALTQGLGFRRAVVVRPHRDRAHVAHSDGTSREVTVDGSRMAPSSVLGEELQPRLVRRLTGVDRALAELLPHATNVVLFPLSPEGDATGLVLAEWGGSIGMRIADDTVRIAAQCLAHVELTLRNIRLQAEVQRLATRDPLTGLPNRRVFEDALARELSRAVRQGTPLSVLLLDIDHFKRVNDAHGHQVGDAVLRHVGRQLLRADRRENTPARYGGEEFVVILPDCDAGQACEAAERLRRAIATDAPLPVTASAGIATFPRCAEDAQALIAVADRALYRAKREGRDRSHSAPRLPALSVM